MAATPEQKRHNIRTALILATIALAFLVGFVVKMVAIGR